MDIGSQQRVIVVQPIEIDEILVGGDAPDYRSFVDDEATADAAEGPSEAPTPQTD